MERNCDRHINPPFLRGSRETACRCFDVLGGLSTAFILSYGHLFVNNCRRGMLDFRPECAIITTRTPRQAASRNYMKISILQRNRHLPEWRFLPLIRIVTVNPKIWNVTVIGISIPPFLRGSRETACRCFDVLGGLSTSFILSYGHLFVNNCRRRMLDFRAECAIITTRTPRQAASRI